MTLVECVMQGETPVPILKVHKSPKGWYWFITEFINKDLSYMYGLIVGGIELELLSDDKAPELSCFIILIIYFNCILIILIDITMCIYLMVIYYANRLLDNYMRKVFLVRLYITSPDQ
jgi:hypothetical protein